MLKMKRKVDFKALILLVIVSVLSTMISFLSEAPVGLSLGIVAASFVMEKDIRSLEKGNFGVVLSLIVNLTIYAIAFIIALKFFSTLTFFYTAIGLIGYRNVVLLKLK